MTEKRNIYQDVQNVVSIRTDLHGECCIDSCDFEINCKDDLAAAINHIIKEHDYSLLHIGTETEPDTDRCMTAAYLGK